MEPQDSLPPSQEPATGLYPEPDESILYTPSYFSKIQFNIILPSTSRSLCLSLFFRFFYQIP
jgi:hypothetical protein